jgi:hypothetical protein
VRRSAIIECTDCGALIEANETFHTGAAWNSRPIEDELLKRIAELEAEIHALKCDSSARDFFIAVR